MSGWDEVLTGLLATRATALKQYAFLLVGDHATAEDLLQEALVRALSRPFAGRSPAECEGYVRRIMVNLSVDGHRRLSRVRRFLPLLATRDEAPDHAAAVADRSDVLAALAGLSPRQRACVVLRFYEDLTVPQIADVLGCGQGSVKRYLSAALDRLVVLDVRQEQERGPSWPSTRN